MIGDSALAAFQTASGVPAAAISLLIRTVVLVTTFGWAGWCVHGEIHSLRHQKSIEESEIIGRIFRILLLVTLMVSLVFI